MLGGTSGEKKKQNLLRLKKTTPFPEERVERRLGNGRFTGNTLRGRKRAATP